MLFDEERDFFDGLIEHPFLVFDRVVIDIGMFQPFPGVCHAFPYECFRDAIALSDTGFEYRNWSGKQDGHNAGKKIFRRDNPLIIAFPDADATALDDAAYFRMGHPIEVVIILFRPFEELPFRDASFEIDLADEMVGVTVGVPGAHGTARRRHDPLDGKAFLETIDDRIFSDTGWSGNDKKVPCVHKKHSIQ